MSKRKKIIIAIIIIISIPLLLYFIAAFKFIGGELYYTYKAKKFYHDRKEFYLKDAKQSLGDKDDPLKTYEQFRQALKQNNIDLALQYVFVTDREKMRKALEDLEVRQNYINMPELKLENRAPCSIEAFACLEDATYYYKYKVIEAQKIYDLGNGIQFITEEPGIHKDYTNFTKNLAGRWQIEY